MFHYRTPVPERRVHIVTNISDALALCGKDVSAEPWTSKPVDCPGCLATAAINSLARKGAIQVRAGDTRHFLQAALSAALDIYDGLKRTPQADKNTDTRRWTHMGNLLRDINGAVANIEALLNTLSPTSARTR